MIAICTTFVAGSFAQEQKKNEIPEGAKSAFATKFPKAQKVEWGIEKPGEFEAEFKLNGTKSSALFDAKGNLLETETEIKESELPQGIKASMAKDFAGYKFKETEKALDAKGNVTYEMEASKGKEEFEVIFDTSGKLIKKEKEKEENKKDKD